MKELERLGRAGRQVRLESAVAGGGGDRRSSQEGGWRVKGQQLQDEQLPNIHSGSSKLP